MPVQFDNFDEAKISSLKNHLRVAAGKNQPKPYEIYVDGMKAVPKTVEPGEFDSYENFLTEYTERIKVVIYDSATSNRNDQYVFVMKARNRQEAIDASLNGFGQGFSTSSPNYQKEREESLKKDWDMDILKKEKADLEKKVTDAEEYIGELQKQLTEAKENGKRIGGIHMGELLSVALEGLARRNTHIIARIPGAEGLAGLIDNDNQQKQNGTLANTEGEATFKKKNDPQLSEQEQALRGLLVRLQHSFSAAELDQLMLIMDALANDKTRLPLVAELLEEEQEEEQETNH